MPVNRREDRLLLVVIVYQNTAANARRFSVPVTFSNLYLWNISRAALLDTQRAARL